MCLSGCGSPLEPAADGGAAPIDAAIAECPLEAAAHAPTPAPAAGVSKPSPPPPPPVKGTPAPIPAGNNSIVCRGGTLVVQNNNTGSDASCTQAHEESHMRDWKGRYGADLCNGVPDGQLPVGGADYGEFLRKSECKAYRAGIACREKLLTTASDADKPGIQSGINRDKALMVRNGC